jgi:hypothetical protein
MLQEQRGKTDCLPAQLCSQKEAFTKAASGVVKALIDELIKNR